MLSTWVVYNRPRDYPDHFVVREQVIDRGTVTPKRECALFKSVEQAREALFNRGLVCIGRMPDDEPQIVEVWV